MPKRKPWSQVVEAHGVSVRIYQGPRGNIYRSVVVGRTTSANGKDRPVEDRKSLGHSDRARARKEARALAAEIAELRLTGRAGAPLTVGRLFRLYFQERGPDLEPGYRKRAESVTDMMERCWGRDLDVADLSQTHVDHYCRERRALTLLPAAMLPREEGESRRGYRKPREVRDGTLATDFRILSAVFNWAHGRKVNGKRLVLENPLRDCTLPKEANPRRPVASHDRYTRTLEHADAVDPAGRLGCILALARFTGRRESAICKLRASDVLLSPARIRATLAALGRDERLADHMPHGAIVWRPEHDKRGYEEVAPIGRSAREALDAYLRRNPRVGDVPLFPAPGRPRKKSAPGAEPTPEQPIRRDLAAKWLLRAEKLARLPKLAGGAFHPYRRLWASERKHLPDVDVAAAGGWRDTRALKASYQHADPETVLQVVEFGG